MRKVEVTPELFSGLVEELVLSYEFREDVGTFSMTTEYHPRSPGSDRDFIRIECHGVRDFTREPGEATKLQRFHEKYSLRAVEGAWVLQDACLETNDGGWRLLLSLGHSFGRISLLCQNLDGLIRGSRARKAGDTWHYDSLETGEPLDFYEPFSGV